MKGYLYGGQPGVYWLGDVFRDKQMYRDGYTSMIHSLADSVQANLARLLDEVFGLSGRHVLDLGCGRGGLMLHMGRSDPWCMPAMMRGIDVDEWAVAHTWLPIRWRDMVMAGDIQKVETWSLLDASNECAKFDLVVATEVFEHLDNPEAAMALLKPRMVLGGHVFFTAPDPETDTRPDVEHVHRLTSAEWITLWTDHGFIYLPAMSSVAWRWHDDVLNKGKPFCDRMKWSGFVLMRCDLDKKDA